MPRVEPRPARPGDPDDDTLRREIGQVITEVGVDLGGILGRRLQPYGFRPLDFQPLLRDVGDTLGAAILAAYLLGIDRAREIDRDVER